MSTETPVQRTCTRLNSAEKAALIAAVAGGMSQAEAAQHFNVHRNTVSRLCGQVRAVDNPANPLNGKWENAVAHKARAALDRALDDEVRVQDAGDKGLEVLHRLGVLRKGDHLEVDTNVEIKVSWQAPIKANVPQQVVDTSSNVSPIIDVTPQVVDNKE